MASGLSFVFVPNFPQPGVEARGFIFGPPIALAIRAKFVSLRKLMKLPGSGVIENGRPSFVLVMYHQCRKISFHPLMQQRHRLCI